MALYFFNLPGGIRVHDRFALGVTFHEEREAVGDLGERCANSKLPDCGRDQIVSCVQKRREIQSFISPVSQIAARWSFTGALTVDEELEAIIGADENNEVSGFGVQMKGSAKMENTRLAERRRGMRNPTGVPFLPFVRNSLRTEINSKCEKDGGEEQASPGGGSKSGRHKR